VRLFTSRPVPVAELLRRIRPRDTDGTAFAPAESDAEVIDGHGVIEYIPAPPKGLSRLGLDDAAGGRRISPYWDAHDEQ
jgi:hypothetical protein